MFKIEKGIPIPEKKGRRKYPWPQMKVGDSIAIPKKLENSARYSMHYFSKVKTNGKAKFEVRGDSDCPSLSKSPKNLKSVGLHP